MISIISYSKEGELLIKSCLPTIKSLFGSDSDHNKVSLTIVTPQQVIDKLVPKEGLWLEISKAWRNIVFQERGSVLNSWRYLYKYGDEVIPSSKIFKVKNSRNSAYFFLFNENEQGAFSVLNDLLFLFSAWHHLKSKRILFHGAGIIKDNQAYLFLGSSGAGKSTISALSIGLGFETIHDDQVVVIRSVRGTFFSSDIALKKPEVQIRAMYFLVQDKQDKIIPLPTIETAKRLFLSCFETVADKILVGHYLTNAFSNCSAIARVVPGYELHFTKSPAFWKLIDDEKIF